MHYYPTSDIISISQLVNAVGEAIEYTNDPLAHSHRLSKLANLLANTPERDDDQMVMRLTKEARQLVDMLLVPLEHTPDSIEEFVSRLTLNLINVLVHFPDARPY
jgi:hypothetical protein